MDSAHEALKIHVMGLLPKVKTRARAWRIHRRNPMNLEEQSPALQKRDLLANKHWGAFFSKMPLRASNLPPLPYSRAIHARPDGKNVTSPVSIDSFEVEFESER